MTSPAVVVGNGGDLETDRNQPAPQLEKNVHIPAEFRKNFKLKKIKSVDVVVPKVAG